MVISIMLNSYKTKLVIIKRVIKESSDVKRFVLEFENKVDQENFDFIPGQFIKVSVPGLCDAPFTFGTSPKNKENFEIAVRGVGNLTNFLNRMQVGQKLGIRGPYGNGFPMDIIKKRNVLIVSGGCGFVPFKSIIEDYLIDKKNYQSKFQIFYGARSFDDLLFRDDFEKWENNEIELKLMVDKGGDAMCKDSKYKCNVGLVTDLIKNEKLVEKPVVLVCGPPIMVKFVVMELDKLSIPHSDIFVSLERRMECGVGICEHCAIGPYYVCKDGPVFSWDKIEWIPGVV